MPKLGRLFRPFWHHCKLCHWLPIQVILALTFTSVLKLMRKRTQNLIKPAWLLILRLLQLPETNDINHDSFYVRLSETSNRGQVVSNAMVRNIDARNHTIGGLNPAIGYTVELATQNTAGFSQFSEPVSLPPYRSTGTQHVFFVSFWFFDKNKHEKFSSWHFFTYVFEEYVPVLDLFTVTFTMHFSLSFVFE